MVEFEAERAGAAVEHGGDAAAEAVEDVGGRGGADPAGEVGRRRGERAAEAGEEALRQRVPRHPQRHAGEAGGGALGETGVGAARQHQRQRAGPEAGGQRAGLGREDGEALGGGEVGDVDDERVERGPPLGGEDAGHGAVAQRVGAEAVDGLGRKGDELARAQEARGGAEAALGSGKDDGVPLGHRRCLDRPPPGVNCASTLWGRAGPPKVAPRALSGGMPWPIARRSARCFSKGRSRSMRATSPDAGRRGLPPLARAAGAGPGDRDRRGRALGAAAAAVPARPSQRLPARRRRRLDARRHRPRHRRRRARPGRRSSPGRSPRGRSGG